MAVAALWLAGATRVQADWVAVRKELRNESRSPWVIDFFEAPTATMGYAFASGAAAAGPGAVLKCRGKVVLAPGCRMSFHRDYPSNGVLSFQLRDQAGTQGAVLGKLDLEPLGSEPGFREERRFKGASAPSQAVLVVPGQITILDLDAAAPAHREVKAETKGAAKGSLPALSDEDREAGVFTAYYTVGRIRYQEDWAPLSTWAAALHGRGHQLSQASLLDMFFNTMFQYYTFKLVNYDATLNYDQYLTMAPGAYDDNYRTWLTRFCEPRGVSLVPVPAPGGDFTAFQNYRTALATARAALMANENFCRLATAYMRQKIVCEKLVTVAKEQIGRGESPKAVNALSSRHSVLTSDIQVMIYNWMDHAYGLFVNRYLTAPEAGKLDAGTPLATFTPDFLGEPYYEHIMNHLDEHLAPVTTLEGVHLP